MDKPVFDKDLVLPDKLIHLSKTRVSNARGSPWGSLIPSPRVAIKLRTRHPRDWQREKMPRSCPGGWAALELIDALRINTLLTLRKKTGCLQRRGELMLTFRSFIPSNTAKFCQVPMAICCQFIRLALRDQLLCNVPKCSKNLQPHRSERFTTMCQFCPLVSRENP